MPCESQEAAMPNEHDGLSEPRDELSDAATELGDELIPSGDPTPFEELRRFLSEAAEEELLRNIPREPGSGIRFGDDFETRAAPSTDVRKLIDQILSQSAKRPFKHQWFAFYDGATEAPDRATELEAIRAGFLEALDELEGESEADKTGPATVGAAFTLDREEAGESEPTPPAESVLDYLEPEPVERPRTSKFGTPDQGRPRWGTRSVAIGIVGVAALALLAFFVLSGGGGDDETSSGSGPEVASTVAVGGTGNGATGSEPAAATATSEPTVARTPTAVEVPTLVVCPDGSTFSGFEQADGSYLDAETNEPRVCPPPPN